MTRQIGLPGRTALGFAGILAILLAETVAWARPGPGGLEAHQAPTASWFESDAAPVAVTVSGNPLDYAAERIGLDLRNMELPRAWEGGYRLACRFPIIEDVSYRPLYMKQWAQGITDAIRDEQTVNGISAASLMIQVLGSAGPTIPPAGRRFGPSSLRAAPCANRDSLRLRSPEVAAVLDAIDAALDPVPLTPEYKIVLRDLTCKLAAGTGRIRRVLRMVAPEDSVFFAANPGYFFAPDGQTMPELTGDVTTQFDFIERARCVRMDAILPEAMQLCQGLEDYRRALADLAARSAPAHSDPCLRDPRALAAPLIVPTPFGDFVLAGPAADHHEKDAWVLIDLGGDDLYTNDAGGCSRPGEATALVLDHGGNDVYDAADRPYTQGFGFLGAGFLVDLGGDDRYKARHFCQGAGILGAGVIADFGGNDEYDAEAVCQGAALFGLGAILDSSGDDRYDCATIGQGSASTLGLGLLSDLEGGDRYDLGTDSTKNTLGRGAGFGQGGALSFRHYPWNDRLTAYGGVGILNDVSGNDRYRSRGWCDQGGSYILSLGVLNDGDGNDQYVSRTGLGSGIHVTNAILIDRNGNDVYEGAFRAGGSGGDRSPGFLIDYHGDDVYRSESSSFGTGVKPFSCSLLIDYEGNDLYESGEPKGEILFNCWDSFGGVWPESEPHLWPYAIHLDLGGNDDYRVRNRANNSERLSFGHGIHLDCEWKGGDVIGEVPSPIPRTLVTSFLDTKPFGLQTAEAEWARLPLVQLGSRNLFASFQAVQPLVDGQWWVRNRSTARIDTVRHTPGESAAAVARLLRICPDLGYGRALMECLQYALTRRQVGPAEIPFLRSMLTARLEEVRAIAAFDLGYWKFPGCDSALVAALRDDTSSRVRRSAADALMRLRSPAGIAAARELAVTDPSEDVRRVCLRYLGVMAPEARRAKPETSAGAPDLDVHPILCQAMLGDPSPAVRTAACQALGEQRDPRALEPLQIAAASGDVYLQRAAAIGLARLGQVEAIDILIRSLEFPSIDAFYNYGRNVPNTIAAYCAHELPEAERYDRRNWRTWFDAHRDQIKVAENAAAYDDFTEMVAAVRDSTADVRVREHERFLERYPSYAPARKQVAALLNGEAWKLATAPSGSRNRDPATALAWARRAVALDPQPDFVDTLVEALVAGGRRGEARRICEEQLKKDPANGMFRRRLASLEADKEDGKRRGAGR